ncbi:MAG: hypothetical protein AABM30_06130 [Actinomycetota bacterium]
MPRAALAAVVVAVLVMPGAAAAHSGIVLRGYGTATVDGVPAAGEWDAAGRHDFNAPLPAELGGGTIPATVYVMNDGQKLYVALRVASASTAGTTSFLGAFDNNHSGTLYEQGDEVMIFERSGPATSFQDGFISPIPNGFCWCIDTAYGGTDEQSGGYTRDAGASYYELSHPLDTADDSHDFSVGPGRRLSVGFDYVTCGFTQCAVVQFPPRGTAGAPGDVAIVSTDHTSPETQITSGPAEGSISTPSNFEFTFAGTDAGIPPDTLIYECKLGDHPYEPCPSPYRVLFADEGTNMLSVRALDDWDLADPTPAVRSWRVDGTGPTRPRVVGPRVTRSRSPVYRFSATDAVSRANEIRFRCSFDSARLHSCPARYHQRLRRGRHKLRVRAVDAVGNAGPLATVRVLGKKR